MPLIICEKDTIWKPFQLSQVNNKKYLWEVQPGGWTINALSYGDRKELADHKFVVKRLRFIE